MTTILVTGGAGAIGSHLAARLVEDGNEVIVVDDLSSGHRQLVPAGVTFVEGSILDESVLDAAFSSRPNAVAHLAALFANQNSVDHAERDLLVNGLGTLKLLERSVASGVAKVLVCSSSCVYGDADHAEESGTFRASETPYAITKALGEDYARYFSQHHGLNTVVVRPFNAYGPHEHPGRYRNVIPNFLAAAMRGEALSITGTGEETRDFTYIGDIAAGMVRALSHSTAPGETFNLASGRPTTINALAAMINELTGNVAGVVHGPRRSWDRIGHRAGSIDRARAVLGYEPMTSLADGLRATYEWLAARD